MGARWSGIPVLALETRGRRSGRHHTVPLVYIEDEARRVVLPAAAGSDRTPAWWLNLQEQPRAVMHVDGSSIPVIGREASTDEHDRLWHQFAAVYPDIEAFASYTERRLPLVILELDTSAERLSAGGSRSEQLGQRRWVHLTAGDVAYRETGSGPVLLFVHGLWVNGDVWRRVVPLLASSYRCIAPDWPLGAHACGLANDADLRPEGVADLIAEFIDAIGAGSVTLVANDTGLAYAQVLLARRADLAARLVITPGDVGRNFLPWGIKWMRPLSYIPGAVLPLAHCWNTRVGRAVIMAPLARHRPPNEVLSSWFEPATRDRGLRRDLAKLLRAAGPRATLAAARELGTSPYTGPVLIAWTASENFVFPLRHALALHRLLPNSRIELIDRSRAFISEDQPDALAEAIRRFVPYHTDEARAS